MARLDDKALLTLSALVHPPITIIALLFTAATPALDLADGNEAILVQDLVEASYILISDIGDNPCQPSLPTTTGGDAFGTRAVSQ